MRTAFVEPSGLQVIDSLLPGPAELDVRSFAFNRLRDTIEIRAGYVDTLMVGLTAACK